MTANSDEGSGAAKTRRSAKVLAEESWVFTRVRSADIRLRSLYGARGDKSHRITEGFLVHCACSPQVETGGRIGSPDLRVGDAADPAYIPGSAFLQLSDRMRRQGQLVIGVRHSRRSRLIGKNPRIRAFLRRRRRYRRYRTVAVKGNHHGLRRKYGPVIKLLHVPRQSRCTLP